MAATPKCQRAACCPAVYRAAHSLSIYQHPMTLGSRDLTTSAAVLRSERQPVVQLSTNRLRKQPRCQAELVLTSCYVLTKINIHAMCQVSGLITGAQRSARMRSRRSLVTLLHHAYSPLHKLADSPS
jgi:hypothetical protein